MALSVFNAVCCAGNVETAETTLDSPKSNSRALIATRAGLLMVFGSAPVTFEALADTKCTTKSQYASARISVFGSFFAARRFQNPLRRAASTIFLLARPNASAQPRPEAGT